MKYNKELINWFNNYFYNCYYVKHDDYPESIFMYYDKNYVRQLKLAKLEGVEYVEKTDITGVCLFEQDWKNKFFCCNYEYIWSYLRDKCSFNYDDIQSFIMDRLDEHTKRLVLTPVQKRCRQIDLLDEHTKRMVLTPPFHISSSPYKLDDHTKMMVLTPSRVVETRQRQLDDHKKMMVLTPHNMMGVGHVLLVDHKKMMVLTPSSERKKNQACIG